jgi:2-polyprenyl-6-hydroxyphenyl methylase/3-demethylubiquinone-9 3-methyltransferase
LSNVDIDEVNKFAALASRWWDKNSEFKPLHDINPLRLNYIKEKCGGSFFDNLLLNPTQVSVVWQLLSLLLPYQYR